MKGGKKKNNEIEKKQEEKNVVDVEVVRWWTKRIYRVSPDNWTFAITFIFDRTESCEFSRVTARIMFSSALLKIKCLLIG